ncbi:MAG: ABC transporter ATP-binding protein [Planctomycetota bacterium]
MSAHTVEIAGLEYDYPGTQALAGLSLSVLPGQTWGLVGNNGAGKTTTLQCVMGLLRPTRGTVRVFGIDPYAQPREVRRRAGFVSEADAPYDWMSVRHLRRIGRMTFDGWDEPFAGELAERFSLDPKKKFKSMSKGMVTKSKLLYAMAHRPELLVLDEPTSGLDPGSRFQLLEMLDELRTQRGVTTLLSSHNFQDIETAATHVAVIAHGRIAWRGTLRDVTERSLFVAVDADTEAPPPGVCVPTPSGRQCLIDDRHAPEAKAWLAEARPSRQCDPTFDRMFRFLTTGNPVPEDEMMAAPQRVPGG